MPTVSVVIATRDRPEYLAATLATLARQRAPADEVIVVDDGSDPPLPEEFGGARVVRREGRWQRTVRPHLQAARNFGIRWAQGEIVLLMDDDGLVRETFVAEHRERHRRAPGHLVVGSVCRIDYRGVDLTYRLMRTGVPLRMDGELTVYHQEHARDPARQEERERRNLWLFAHRHGFWAYGTPPREWQGPRRYPATGAWFRARAILNEGEPTAIRVERLGAPVEDAPQARSPLDWVLGAPGVEPAGVTGEAGGSLDRP